MGTKCREIAEIKYKFSKACRKASGRKYFIGLKINLRSHDTRQRRKKKKTCWLVLCSLLCCILCEIIINELVDSDTLSSLKSHHHWNLNRGFFRGYKLNDIRFLCSYLANWAVERSAVRLVEAAAEEAAAETVQSMCQDHSLHRQCLEWGRQSWTFKWKWKNSRSHDFVRRCKSKILELQ